MKENISTYHTVYLFHCQTTLCFLSSALGLNFSFSWVWVLSHYNVCFHFITLCSFKDLIRPKFAKDSFSLWVLHKELSLWQILRHCNEVPLKPKTKYKASCSTDSRGFSAVLQSSFVAYFGEQRGKEEGGAFGVWWGCWGPSLQNCLSIGAASVSSPSHQTGAWQRGGGAWERGSKVKLMPWMFDSSGPHCWRPRLIVKVQSSKRGAE